MFEGDSDPDDDFEILHVSDDSASGSEEETADDDLRSRSRPTVPDEVGLRPDQFQWQEIDLEPERQRIDPNFIVTNSTSAHIIDFEEIKVQLTTSLYSLTKNS